MARYSLYYLIRKKSNKNCKAINKNLGKLQERKHPLYILAI